MNRINELKEIIFSKVNVLELKGEEKQRIENELSIIEELNYAEKYLVAYDFVCKCQELEIRYETNCMVLCSYIAYILGIIKFNPIEDGLIFELFLHHQIKNVFDICFFIENSSDDENCIDSNIKVVYDYLLNKYGNKNIDIISNRIDGKENKAALLTIMPSSLIFKLSEIKKKIEQETKSPLVIDYNNKKTLDGFNKFHTDDIPFFDNDLARDLLRFIQIRTIKDLAILDSLIMPNSEERATKYLNAKDITCDDYLSFTKGLILFREQLLKYISQELKCDYSDSSRIIREVNVRNEEEAKKIIDTIINKNNIGLDSSDFYSEIKSINVRLKPFAYSINSARLAYEMMYYKENYGSIYSEVMIKIGLDNFGK